jgi:hypothetical protein
MTSRFAEPHLYDDVLPWLHVKPEPEHSYHLAMLRLEARRRGEEGLREVDLGRLLTRAPARARRSGDRAPARSRASGPRATLDT